MQAADVLTFATQRRESGLPMVVLEAAACGLPIVSTTAAGLPPELIESGVALVDFPASPPELAEALRAQAVKRIGQPFLPPEYSTTTLADRVLPIIRRYVRPRP
jgi:glycosyltransferase involved in cell wall biosynthesis